jgi:class 3 adenylate cyclase
MAVHTTVVFTDLAGSTGLFESLGNAKATEAVTRLTRWIGEVIEAHEGRVVKNLGDGVLGTFADATDAMYAALEIQRAHQIRLARWPAALRTEIKIGLAHGDVVEVDGDFYGDAVNVASRLSDICGPSEILSSESVLGQIEPFDGLRYRHLGQVSLRGRNETSSVCHIEWHEESVSHLMTMQASLPELEDAQEPILGQIHLQWEGGTCTLVPHDMPVHCGRSADAPICVNDPRVSRLHIRLDWRGGAFVLSDLSSFGTWVRFEGADADVLLRREECILHGRGVIALGVAPTDVTAPKIQFAITSTRVFRQAGGSGIAPLAEG